MTNKFLLLIIILLLAIFLLLFFPISEIFPAKKKFPARKNFPTRENYINLGLGRYPNTENEVLLQNSSYPITRKNGVSNKESSDIWWYDYVSPYNGSYEQITNNLRYRNNPDNGQCSRSEFCGTLYKDFQKESNISQILPPVKQTCGARINYYNTPENLLTFRNITSILY